MAETKINAYKTGIDKKVRFNKEDEERLNK